MTDQDIENELIPFTQELVRCPSLPGQEGEAAALVQRRLEAWDWDQVWVDERGSVVASRLGKAPGPRLLFDAHLDVVPATNPQDWSGNPFSGDLHDGKLWGRGATDIKGGLAALVCGLSALARDEFAGTLLLSASVGEELMEGAGLRGLVPQVRPDCVVIVEPTGCRLCTGHKGRAEFWIEVSGRPAHTSRPELGDNAIYRAIEIVQALKGLPLPSDPVLGSGVMELIEISSRPFPGECIVPFGCRLRYDRRLVPGETRETLQAELQRALESYTGWGMGFQPVVLETYTGQRITGEAFYPAWTLPAGSPWLVKAQAGLEAAGLPAGTLTAPYCTNGAYTAGELGLPTLIFGPSHIRLAHGVDEHIELEELQRGLVGLQALARGLGQVAGG